MKNPLSARFHTILKELGDLHDKKQADYGRPEDPFANVRGSQEWGVEPWKGAMVRANDKIKRLQKYAQTGSLENEGVEDSLKDLAVYAVIALCLWEEGQPRKITMDEAWKQMTMMNPIMEGPRTEPSPAPTPKLPPGVYTFSDRDA